MNKPRPSQLAPDGASPGDGWILDPAGSGIFVPVALQQVSEKGQPNGYASLGSGGLVPSGELGTGTADSTTVLYGDGVWAVPPSGGGSPTVEDEGTSLGTAGTFNFTGAGVTASVASGVATVNIPGGAAGGGAWTAYTPTIGGTGWALGNGTISGRYRLIDANTLAFEVTFIFGSTTTVGSGQATISLPSGKTSATGQWANGRHFDTSQSAVRPAGASIAGSSGVLQVFQTGSNTNTQLEAATSTATTPPAAGDNYIFTGVVELA